MNPTLRKLRAKLRSWRNMDDLLDRRALVEQYLYDCAGGRRPLPNEEECFLLARKLGTPSYIEKIKLPRREK